MKIAYSAKVDDRCSRDEDMTMALRGRECRIEGTVEGGMTVQEETTLDYYDYYSQMLDLEGLDPELGRLELPWHEENAQKALLSFLFKKKKISVIESLLLEGVVNPSIGEPVGAALKTAQDIYGNLEGVGKEAAMLTPRQLAEAELLLWRADLSGGLEDLLAVEVPVRLDWLRRQVNIEEEESVVQFYRETDSYVFELMAANNLIQTLYNYDVVVRKMKELGVSEFLDYGAGIGTFVILGRERGFSVRHMDLEGCTSDFARWRYMSRGMDIPILVAKGDHSDIPRSPAIVCTEVVEHLFRPLHLLNALAQAIPVGGFVVISESCGYVEKFISHLPQNRWLAGAVFDQEMAQRGFLEVLPEPRVHPRIYRKVQ
ncbi:MAG TPA: methyltransferase domain-containing protein [Thermoanaerobaculia bacterium]|nr:methyltransferase domain-containing protein [Thermoanaerobaculia bacterium]